MLREPSQPERDAIAATNQPSLALVAQLAMTYLAANPPGDYYNHEARDGYVDEAVDMAYQVLREIRRRGEALDAAAQVATPPDKL